MRSYVSWFRNVRPGQLWTYSGDVPCLGFRRLVQVLESNPREQYVVCCFWIDLPNSLEVEIDFIPYSMSSFKRSRLKMLGELPVDPREEAASEFKKQREEGNAGLFTLSLADSRRASWETVHVLSRERSADTHFIQRAFPIRNRQGQFSKVQAVSFQRPASIAELAHLHRDL